MKLNGTSIMPGVSGGHYSGVAVKRSSTVLNRVNNPYLTIDGARQVSEVGARKERS